MSNGKELFETIQARRSNSVVGSDEWTYAQTLMTAFALFGPDELFPLLEEADRTGKRIELIEDLTVLGEPTGMILV